MKRYRHALTMAIYMADDKPGAVRVELGDRIGGGCIRDLFGRFDRPPR
jgi:hypothetical protein